MPVHRAIRAASGALLLATGLVAGLMTGTAAATPIVLVDDTPRAALAATAMRGDDLVVTWRQPVDGVTVPVAVVSADGGASWRPPRAITGLHDAGQVDADACPGVAAVAYVSDTSTPAQPQRASAGISVHATSADGGWNNFGIASGRVRDARVACRGAQLLVAWAAFTDGAWRLRAALWGDAEDYLPGHVTPAVRQTFSLGRSTGPGSRRPSIDATGDRAFVAWVTGNRLRLARWTTAAEAPHDLVRLDDLGLARGTASEPLRDPLVAVDDDRVIVAWVRCGDLWARVSADGGATFAPAVRLFDGRCGRRPAARLDGLAAADGSIAISARIARAAGPQARILTSDDGLATRSWLVLDQAGDRWIAGWAGSPAPELGSAGDLGDAIAWYPPGTLEP